MRHLLPCGMVALVAFALAAPATAQGKPKGDIAVSYSKSLAVRFQGDYRAIRANGGYGNEFRFATGIVYRF